MSLRRKSPTLIALILLVSRFPLLAASLTGRDWPAWRGPFGNRTTDERRWNPQALEGGAKIRWRINVGKGHGALSVKNGRVYAFGNQEIKTENGAKDSDVVTCLEARTGSIIWHYATPSRPGNSPGPRATPTVDGDRVYTHNRHGLIHCLSADSGKIIWSTDLQTLGYREPRFGFCSSPILHENLLLICVGGSGIALDKHSGKEIWSGDKHTVDCQSSPVLFQQNGQTVTALTNREHLIIANVQTGRVLQTYPWGFARNDPSVFDHRVILSNTQEGITLLDVSVNPPKPLWQRDDLYGSLQGFVIYKKRAFGFGRGSQRSKLQFGGPLQCIDLSNGSLAWQRDLGLWGSMILIHDKLMILTGDGRLIVARASGQAFQEISSASIFPIGERDLQGPHNACWTMPVFSHGHAYLRTIRGELACVDMR